ncbi:MAG: 3-hydroxyacyl-CoA dehydrogenase NAD-binding domain-containing protein, partial [Archaeoglobaceae archaeon]
MEINRVAVIGAGTMGSDVSLLFALSGYEVVVNDIFEKALSQMELKYRRNIEELQKVGVTKYSFEEVWERVFRTTKLEDVRDVDFVLEAVNEELNLKRTVFRKLEDILPNTVFATNTSSLRVTEVAGGMRKPERLGGMHFSNPPILMPLVEVVKGDYTSEETVKLIEKLAEKIGKTPVVLKKDMRGFVLNRILTAAGAEGLWAIQRGEVTAEELDTALKSMGFPVGLVEAIDLIGVDILVNVGRNFREAYGDRFSLPIDLLEKMIEEGRLGKKTGKGFYDWTSGVPKIEVESSKTYDVTKMVATATNEAFWIISDEIADPETIDKVTKLGMMSPVGLCELADTLGLDILASSLNEMYRKHKLELYKL